MKRFEAELLRLAQIERDSNTIAFLYRERHSADDPSDIPPDRVPAELEEMRSRGWIDLGPNSRWRVTASGSSALRASEDWRFEVSDTFRVTGREYLFAVGALTQGVVHQRDWFRVVGQPATMGHVMGIEFARPKEGDERIVLALDREVSRGDVLERFEPLAG